MQNLNDLIKELTEVFDAVKEDRMDLDKANVLCTTAGKIVSTVNTQIQIIMLGGTETTQFMKGTTEPLRKLQVETPTKETLRKKLHRPSK